MPEADMVPLSSLLTFDGKIDVQWKIGREKSRERKVVGLNWLDLVAVNVSQKSELKYKLSQETSDQQEQTENREQSQFHLIL